MALSDTAIRNAKPAGKPVKITDGDGLYLLVQPSGAKWWRFDYRLAGKRKTLSMGVYPEVSLKQAREKRDEARKLVAAGVDPSAHRKATKEATVGNTFEAVAREWYGKQVTVIKASTADKLLRRLEGDVFPFIGAQPIDQIAAPDVLKVIKRIDGRGAHDIARRMHQAIGRIFSYGVGHGFCARNPARDIETRDVLRKRSTNPILPRLATL